MILPLQIGKIMHHCTDGIGICPMSTKECNKVNPDRSVWLSPSVNGESSHA